MEGVKSCRNCKHCIFDRRWGEVKCKHYKHKIYYPEFMAEDCPQYKQAEEINEVVNKKLRSRKIPD